MFRHISRNTCWVSSLFVHLKLCLSARAKHTLLNVCIPLRVAPKFWRQDDLVLEAHTCGGSQVYPVFFGYFAVGDHPPTQSELEKFVAWRVGGWLPLCCTDASNSQLACDSAGCFVTRFSCSGSHPPTQTFRS